MLKTKNYTYIYVKRLQTALAIASILATVATAVLAIFHFRLLFVTATAALAVFLILANLLIDKFVGGRILKQIDNSLKQLAAGGSVTVTPKQIRRHQMFRRIGGVARHYNELERYAEITASGQKYEPLNTLADDSFMQAISKLKQHLDKLASEENDWKEQELKRNWMNQGVAKFSDIMRQSNRSMGEIANELLRQLIKYTDCNQGGIFVRENTDDEFLTMIASYAYDRQKFPDKKCSLEDGLIAAVYHEKASLFMTDIPEEYLAIRSGMGEASPRCLFLVPLICDENVLGIIELASFSVLDEHKQKFIEKIAESFASTLSASHLNNTTVKLLEKAQKQAEQLKTQEEELRQSIEEMQTQQEEMETKQHELEESENLMRRIIDLVPYPIFVKNIHRQYIVANQEEGKLYNMPVDSLLGHSDDELVNDIDELNAIHESDTKVLEQRQMIKLPEQTISLPDGTRRVLQTIKVPFINNITHNPNILGVSFDLTSVREMEQQLRKSEAKVKDLENKLAGK
ncbi:MAG: GAF domain-containing protein [Salinivirgaceae bacterium]|nr:GAF domain-containing protein [Salinivirgaceae bacterium]